MRAERSGRKTWVQALCAKGVGPLQSRKHLTRLGKSGQLCPQPNSGGTQQLSEPSSGLEALPGASLSPRSSVLGAVWGQEGRGTQGDSASVTRPAVTRRNGRSSFPPLATRARGPSTGNGHLQSLQCPHPAARDVECRDYGARERPGRWPRARPNTSRSPGTLQNHCLGPMGSILHTKG